MNQNSITPLPTIQIASPEAIRAILARATTLHAAGLAAAAVSLNARALDFAKQLPPYEKQIAMQHIAEAEVAQTGRVAFCAAAERALVAYDVPFVSSARDNLRPEQRFEMGA